MDNSASLTGAARKDLWTAAFLLGITALGFASRFQNAEVLSADYGADPGPDFVPRLLLIVLGLCALGLGASAAVRLVRTGAAPVAAVRWETCRSFILPVLMIATLLVYVRAMIGTGFVPATIAFGLIWLFLIGIQDEGRPGALKSALYLAEAIVITAVVYVVFVKLILVILP